MSPALGIALLILAQFGLIAWLRRRESVPGAVAPAVAAAVSLLIAYACGLAGRLDLAPWVVLGAGGLGLVWELIRAPKSLVTTLIEPAVLWLAAATGGLVVVLQGRRFEHYDDFSHWALVVRVLLRDDRFPHEGTAVIDFHTYPVGTASWEYVVGRLAGTQDWQLMAGQGYLLIACAVALLAVTPRRWWLGLPVVTAAAWLLATDGPLLDSLLVDSVLAAWVIAGLSLLAAQRAQVVRAALPLAVLAAALVSTKQTGPVWAAALILASCCLRTRRWWHRPVVLIVPAAAAGLTQWAWGRHTTLAYGADTDTKHSVSVERFREVLAEKTPAVRAAISDAYWRDVTGSRSTWLLLALLALSLLLLILARRGRGLRALGVLAGAVATVAAYLGGLYAMYLLSMPTNEALAMAGFARYLSTLDLVLLGAVLLLALHIAEQGGWTWAPTALAIVAVTIVAMHPRHTLVPPEPSPTSAVRARVDAAFAGVRVPPGAFVCVFTDVRDGGYRRYLVRYLLMTPNVYTLRAPPRANSSLPVACDYAAVVDPYPAGDTYLRLRGHMLTPGKPVVVPR